MKLLSILLLVVGTFVFVGCEPASQPPPPKPDTNAPATPATPATPAPPAK